MTDDIVKREGDSMTDLTERLRQKIAYDVWSRGWDEASVARDALARIEELEAEVERLRDKVQEAALSGTFFGYRKLEQKLQLAKIERLTAALQKIHDIWDSSMSSDSCGEMMFEVAEKALKET